MLDFKKSAKAVVSGSPLMSGEKLHTSDILGEDLTINNCDLITIDGKPVSVWTFVEKPDFYYLGGSLLTKMMLEWKKENNDKIDDEFIKALQASKVVINLSTGTTRSGKSVTLVNIK